MRAGGADTCRLWLTELGGQQQSPPAAGAAKDVAAQPAVVPQTGQHPVSLPEI